jgi:hypothetical protein
MIRFFCTTCKKQKRVRRLPPTVRPILDLSDKITGYTPGECRWHSERGVSRARSNDRGRVVAGLGSTRKTSASSAKSKSKK